VYVNDGTGTFSDGTEEILGENFIRDALGVIAADLNGDGLRDLYICDRFQAQSNRKDLLLIRNTISALNQQKLPEPEITLFPNPVSGSFHIQTAAEVTALYIENMQGMVLDTIELEYESEDLYHGTLSPQQLVAGMYVFHLYEIQKKLMVLVEN
jgi:hypothetical protein